MIFLFEKNSVYNSDYKMYNLNIKYHGQYQNKDDIKTNIYKGIIESKKDYFFIKLPEIIDRNYAKCKFGKILNGEFYKNPGLPSCLENDLSFYNMHWSYGEESDGKDDNSLRISLEVFCTDSVEHGLADYKLKEDENKFYHFRVSFVSSTHIKGTSNWPSSFCSLNFTCTEKFTTCGVDFYTFQDFFCFVFKMSADILDTMDLGVLYKNIDLKRYILHKKPFYQSTSSGRTYFDTYAYYLKNIWNNFSFSEIAGVKCLVLNKSIPNNYLIWNISNIISCIPLKLQNDNSVFIIGENSKINNQKYNISFINFLIAHYCYNNYNSIYETVFNVSNFEANEMLNSQRPLNEFEDEYIEKLFKIHEWIETIQCSDKIEGINRVGKDDSEHVYKEIIIPPSKILTVDVSRTFSSNFKKLKSGKYKYRIDSYEDVSGIGTSYDKSDEYTAYVKNRFHETIAFEKRDWIENTFSFL